MLRVEEADYGRAEGSVDLKPTSVTLAVSLSEDDSVELK